MIIVKIGGGKDINLEGIVSDLAELRDEFIIVSGANALRDELGERLGTPKKVITSISGYSSVLSDEKAIDLLMMAYAGLRNKRIVELCHRYGINAVGLSGLDGRVIQGRRNRGIRVISEGRKRIIRDLSGKPVRVNRELLKLLLAKGYIPVLSVPIIDEDGFAINSENDDIVRVIHEELPAERILQFIEAPGILKDKDDPTSLIPTLTRTELEKWEERAEGRMRRKLYALIRLLETRRTEIIISDGRVEHPVKEALAGRGTLIK